MKKGFDILDTLSKDEILKRIRRIGSHVLTITGHGFEQYGAITIRQASELSTINYTKNSKERPAIGLISVVLAANRNYNKVVEPNLVRIKHEFPALKIFDQLEEILSVKSQDEFYTFWGHKDAKKYNTLKSLLLAVRKLRDKYDHAINDFELLHKWGKDADIINYKQDIIGSIPNIAVATFQHLRMEFGIDTVKPDQRVKEVLDFEFGLTRLSDVKAIVAVQQIAEIAGLKVITIDQILVKYGSSYYNQNANRVTLKQIVKNLKTLGVDNEIISKATLLSLGQVERI